MRSMQQICGWIAVGCLFVTVALAALFANPSILFAHRYDANSFTLYTDKAHDLDAVQRLLADVEAALNASPLGAPEQPYAVYSTATRLRSGLFFAPVPKAGGVVYPLLTGKHAFLTGIDPAADRLLKGPHVIAPPRTLRFYMIHELTHLRMHDLMGTIGFYRQPHWVREGLPDYVALGALSDEDISAILNWSGDWIDMVRRYGAYPVERAIVSYAIHHLGFSAQALMSLDMTLNDALSMMRADGFGEEV